MLMAQNNPQCLLYDPNGQSAFFSNGGHSKGLFFRKGEIRASKICPRS